jgi:transposase-like protein
MGYAMLEALKPVRRWTFRRKAEVLWALHRGLASVADVRHAYGVSSEELQQWNRDQCDLGPVPPPSSEFDRLHRPRRATRADA